MRKNILLLLAGLFMLAGCAGYRPVLQKDLDLFAEQRLAEQTQAAFWDYDAATPELTDVIGFGDDPSGSPSFKNCTFGALFDLFEAATSDVNTATSTTKFITPDALASSTIATKTWIVKLVATDENLSAGDGIEKVTVPIELDGWTLVTVGFHVYTTSSSGDPLVMIHNLTDTVDMLTTGVSVDATEYDSKDATAAAVIDTNHDDVAEGDVLRFDVDEDGTGTQGGEVRMGFRKE